MDTTLRDGEQTGGVSFSTGEKLTIAQLLLEEINVDRLEIASARVSEGEFESVKRIADWAKKHNHLEKIEVLTFVDGYASIDWIDKAGVKVINLLTKGSINHLTHQLKKTPDQHFDEISKVIDYAKRKGIKVNVYLEDWSNGMRNSSEYVLRMINFLSTQPILRIMLPDTLGILTPKETMEYTHQLVNKFPNIHFDFHAHDDYDLSIANVMEAVKAGAKGLHLTINGMGERAGNAPIASAIAVLNDFFDNIQVQINEKALYKVSKLVETFSGFRIPANKPIVGENVFTQTAGIHADGDNKKNLYFNDLMPERFGRKRKYALGKTSGKANIEKNLQELGIKLSEENLKKVTRQIIKLGDKKEIITAEDLPYIISNVLDNKVQKKKVTIDNYMLTHAKNMRPAAAVLLTINGKTYEGNAQGDGQYNAFMNALKSIYTSLNIKLPFLTDYTVRIPPGGKTDALCETVITWKGDREFKTRGLDSDQTVSALHATERMLNLIE